MSQPLPTTLRSHVTAAIDAATLDRSVRVCGWVHRRRDHGGVIFIDVRDRYGRVQCVASPGETSTDTMAVVESLRAEDVIAVGGPVRRRPAESVNPDEATGAFEVRIDTCDVLNRSKTPPFPIDSDKQSGEVSEDLRLTHRYLDLRRRSLSDAIGLRHKIAFETRRYLDGRGFWEIETPMLTRRTPEGARDYLVPSRVHPGAFYALPQSPQLYKQLLMVGGFDRYFQIARCFRDEDLRADRQPEFSQIDLEMSFVEVGDVIEIVSGLFQHLFRVCLDESVGKIDHLTFDEALSRFGTDKPDMRFGNELVDLTEVLDGTGFRVFDEVVDSGGRLVGLVVPDGAEESRSTLDRWTQFARDAGGRGLVWARRNTDGWKTSVDKFIDSARWDGVAATTGAEPGDLVLIVADRTRIAQRIGGALRVRLADERGWRDPDQRWRLVWVVDFPLFEASEAGGLQPSHHPFTAPKGGLPALAAEDPLAIESLAYDLVLNGYELGSGSIRIHERAVQERVFELLGVDRDEAREKFGFLLRGLEHGAPPHGGVALGLDRIAMLFAGVNSLRDVIAFPKTTRAAGLMEGAPSQPDPGELSALHLQIRDVDRGGTP